ncbi:hypothetical protein [Larkinella punicea]|uniref:Uncharacterized protein n=1 Tax=Larkinella punicea TaxID=2315727 RepID=A0A368JG78_9BACT|nr:hypothetical protein [Larkinella punicea]RCR65553.1 hypothetical protein DUE52_31300 [Larkinella punicea]
MTLTSANRLYVRRPENLYWASILADHPPGFNCSPDKLMYMTDLIVGRLGTDKRLYESKGYPYSPISSQRLREYVFDYPLYLAYMLRVGVIERSPLNYSVGVRSNAYRLTKLYRTQTVTDTITDPLFIHKIYQVTDRNNATAVQGYYYLTRWAGGLKIDAELGYRYAEAFLAHGQQILLSRPKRKRAGTRSLNPKTQREKLYCRHANLYQSIDRIRRGNHYFTVDDSGHRLHTVLTNLKSDLRHALAYQGQSLVSIDLSSSQIYLSVRLIEPSFYEAKPTDGRIALRDLAPNVQSLVEPLIQDIRHLLATNPASPSPAIVQPEAGRRRLNTENMTQRDLDFIAELDSLWRAPIKPITTITTATRVSLPMYENRSFSYMYESDNEVVKLENGSRDDNDWQLLIEQVKQGTFYEYLLQEAVKATGKTKLTRELMKKTVFTVFFSENETTSRLMQKRKEIFRDLFPNVMRLFELIKSQQHRTLALLLQNIESEIFLNRIARRIARERPDLPIFTIHDSIVTTVGNEPFVEVIMREELERAIGIRPFLKREYWQEEVLEDAIDAWLSL